MDPQYLTWEDERNFGPEILDVAQRAARQAMAPVMERLQEESQDLRDHVAREVQRNLHSQVAAAVPNWDAINRDPRWLQWLNTPDLYSGHLRQDLLNDATAKGDAGRVIALFQGFIREVAAGQPGQSGQPLPRQAGPLPSGRVYTRDQITQMWKGKIDDQQGRRWEIELCRASAEGRVRAALDWQTGLPVTL
jgi:hypothetical protein